MTAIEGPYAATEATPMAIAPFLYFTIEKQGEIDKIESAMVTHFGRFGRCEEDKKGPEAGATGMALASYR